MNKRATAEPRIGEVHIVGAEPAGITKKVASRVGRQIKDALSLGGNKVYIKGLRFIPSTKVDLGEGAFQVMANSVIEIAGPSGTRGRAESIDSIVTVHRERPNGQVLRAVKIAPADRTQVGS